MTLLPQAAAAVRKYPLPLSSGEEAMILDNIGKYLELLYNVLHVTQRYQCHLQLSRHIAFSPANTQFFIWLPI